ncbi:MAG: tRNA (adenosine(37)-N6)-threonylcarbamoyltransferase complex dimerization subunit type 1 TsaB [Patescibacteria group bacterium]|nr:tRNA (adenosine(37)-N6)-threonylcarbamoyltransferase complex dimerization subunit type 1 TsaB [Patescibacteria group bacterium]MCL5093668.1 tRNA (adenosine(37)-N6)-threonylcarbamoyltransferase complex dimerization subunit type 1 TsaB [Patescibacteria group bacterium]
MFLLIDTSSKLAQVALANQEKIINSLKWDARGVLSKELLKKIDELFKKTKISPKDLNGLIVYSGPGSYTGLRIGVTMVNSFAYSLKIPIAGIKGPKPGAKKIDIQKLEAINLNVLLKKGLKIFVSGGGEIIVSPFYGKEPNVGSHS